MWLSILLAAQTNITWHLIPLAIAISLVYSASRYELPTRVLHRAARIFLTIILFMVAVFVILFALSYRL